MTPGFALNLPAGGPIPTAGLFAGGPGPANQQVSDEFLELLAPLLEDAPPVQNAPVASLATKTETAGATHGDADSAQKKPQKNKDDNQPATAPIPSPVPTIPPILLSPLAFTLGLTRSTAADERGAPGVQELPPEKADAAAASSSTAPPDKIFATLVDGALDITDSANPAKGAGSEPGTPERQPGGLAFGARLVPAEDNQAQPAPPQESAAVAGAPPAGELTESSPPPDGNSEGSETVAGTGQPDFMPAPHPATSAPAQPVLTRIATAQPAAGDSGSEDPIASQAKSGQQTSTGSETGTAAASALRGLAEDRAQPVAPQTEPAVAVRPAPGNSSRAELSKWAGMADSQASRQRFEAPAGESPRQADGGGNEAVVETGRPRVLPASFARAGEQTAAGASAEPALSRMVRGSLVASDSGPDTPIASQGKESSSAGSDNKTVAPVEPRDRIGDRAQPAGSQMESGAAVSLTLANQPAPPGGLPGVHLPTEPVSVPRTPAKAVPSAYAGASGPETAPPAGQTPVKSAPASEISLSVPGRNQDGVQVRVVERAGEVHVTVRTPDGELARDLRQDLSQLVARLEQKGYQAETWRPSGTADTFSQDRQQQRGAPGENPSGNPGGAGEQGGGQRGSSQQQKERSKWLQEMERSFGPGQ